MFAERAMGTLARSAHSILQVMQNIEKDETDRKRLETEWGRHAAIECTLKARLLEKYREETVEMVEKFRVHFDSGMAVSCAAAACKASSDILRIAEKIVKTTSWQRFRAALRRSGVYEDLNINYEFTAPFISTIVCAWQVTLDQNVFPKTSKALERVTLHLLNEIPGACHSSSFKQIVMNRVALMFEEATSTLEALHAKVAWQIDKSRRRIATSIVPHIKDQLVEGYEKALEYEGTGSVALQKEYFIAFVGQKREIIFTDLHDFILEDLNSLADSIGDVVGNEIKLLADKIHNEMSLLWRDGFNLKSRRAIKLRETTEKFEKLLETWIDASKDIKMECAD
ncbi:hypothetical protein C0992_005518 [Termitomyces sp. T32_za158]|nr:hypothetical protein C0992_005518 [Termitomyces sp. T32_za158]